MARVTTPPGGGELPVKLFVHLVHCSKNIALHLLFCGV